MILTYDTIKELVNSQEMSTVRVKPLNDGFGTFTSCNTLYMRDGEIFKSEAGDTYVIEGFTGINGNFRVKPPEEPEVPIFNGTKMILERKPYFIGGKPLTANSEWLQASTRSAEKLPLIWYVTNSVERYGSQESGIVEASNVLLYFLDQTDERKWTTDKHYSDIIPRMNNLMNRFKELLDKDSYLTRNSFEARPWERFGREDIKGSRKKIINEDLSGYEVLTSFDIRGCINC